MKEQLLMTPGPTYVNEAVRNAMAQPITNPDLDTNFYEFYKETCTRLQAFLHTKNEVLILDGEGILGLEAACASLIEPGDPVLCIDNGIFGAGFIDFVEIYGGEVTRLQADYQEALDVDALADFLRDNHDFKVATLVHCETPSGITNPIDRIAPLLHSYGILTIVDSVSAMGGEPLLTDEWKIDIALGGSQKCLSAPPGLTIVSVSDAAWKAMKNRKTPIAGFYCNLRIWENWYEKQWFPYTQPISALHALRKAVDQVLADKDILKRHAAIAQALRKSLIESGLTLYPKSGFSNTVTTINVPEGISFSALYQEMLDDHHIMIGGAFGYLKDQVFRIGHMGENCYDDKVFRTLRALDKILRKHKIALKKPLHHTFLKSMDEAAHK